MKSFFENNKKVCIISASALVLIAAAVITLTTLVSRKNEPDNTSDNSSSSEPTASISVKAPESEPESSETLPDTDNYISPDESNADKVLSETAPVSSKQEQTAQKPQTETKKEEPAQNTQTEVKKEETASSAPEYANDYEKHVAEREERVRKYLEENGIDPATAGETGELCPGCGKKLWNPNKYGLANPGYPEDYENSGYCNGWCTVQVG